MVYKHIYFFNLFAQHFKSLYIWSMNNTVTGNKYYNRLKQMTSIQCIYPSVSPNDME